MAAISPSRKAAFEILLAVERGRAHSDDLLRDPAVNKLSPADRNLVTTLVLGVLRWQIALDAQIKTHLKKPNAKLDPEVSIALRLGVFQLFHLDRIPAHAAIDESVELTKHSGHRFASGMVNAVLRSASRSKPASSDHQEHSAIELALAQAHPQWLVDRWITNYGIDATRALCRHGQAQPPLTIRIASPVVADELTGVGIQLSPGALLTSARTVISADVTATAAFDSGLVRIQDEGSQLIAEIACASASLIQDQKKLLDTCAAPGGKTLILAERMPHAAILACESNEKRLSELKKRLAPHSSRIEFRLADASALTDDSVFDFALVDVPCSGTGTLGRNPEIRHRLKPDDLARHAERQQAILRAAIRAVRPGGRIVYSTCSLEPEENEQVVAAVLANNSTARQISLAPQITALRSNAILTPSAADSLTAAITPEGALRLLPGAFPTDGFFIALIEKSS